MIIAVVLAGVALGVSLFKPAPMDACATSKVRLEMIDLCEKQKSCLYSIDELKSTASVLAACEVAKMQVNK